MNRLIMLSTLVLMLFASTAAHGAAYTVNSAADTTDGTCDATNCTLREAINAVNADGSGSISFAIGSGPATIDLAGDLPAITAQVVLDAATQPGYAGTPLIRIRNTTQTATTGLSLSNGNTTVRGFDITDVAFGIRVVPATNVSNIAIERNFIAADLVSLLTPTTCILVAPAGGSVANLTIGNADPSGRNVLGRRQGLQITGDVSGTIAGNYFGIADDGVTALTGSTGSVAVDAGIDLRASSTSSIVVGGSTAGSRNVISGSPSTGVRVQTSSAQVRIEGNYIGLDAAGSMPRYNVVGVTLITAANVTIAGNVIVSGVSPGSGTGISVTSNSNGNIIRGNFIGTDATGNSVLPILGSPIGIRVQNSSGTIIGGTASADRNIVAGSAGTAPHINLTACSNTIIAGNYVGVAGDGTTVTPSSFGVRVQGTLGAFSGNIIGGSAAGAGNVIAGSTVGAVDLETSSSVTVQGNKIGLNPAGTAALSTSGVGIRVTFAAASHMIGGAGVDEGNTIAGIQFGGPSSGNGIVASIGSVTIRGNRIGTDVTGTVSIPNQASGIVLLNTVSAVIGGTAPGEGNLISGNGEHGIRISSGASATILGNRIGTDAAGTAALPNNLSGISTILTLPQPIIIGGTAAGAGNLISGNGQHGIEVVAGGIVSILGNRIGTNDAGTAQLPNGGNGIDLSNVQAVTIGGTVPGARNIISGSANDGIAIRDASVATILGNFIGTNIGGTGAVGNGTWGIEAASTSTVTIGDTAAGAANLISGNQLGGISTVARPATIVGNLIGTNVSGSAPINLPSPVGIMAGGGSVIGGTAPGAGNVIAFHTGAGIAQTSGTGTAWFGNSIHDNGGLAVDLENDGLTANDSGDGDSGANNRQNFPTLVSAVTGGNVTTVNGTLSSSPSSTYIIELFSNTAGDAEARTYLGRTTAVTDAAGNAGFSATVSPVVEGNTITAIATNQATNDSSEVSPATTVAAFGTFQFSAATTSVAESAGNVTLTVTRTGGTLAASVDYTTANGTALTGSDYAATGGTLAFGTGEMSQTIVVPITNDSTDEADETFSVALSNAGGASIGAPSTAVVTITDDDAAPSISAANASVVEGNSGTTTLTFNVSLSAPSGQTVTVDYTTTDGTANAGSDYGARFGTLTFAPGDMTKSVAITINGDGMAEADETLQLLLSNASNATLGSNAIGTITNDDGPPSISIGDVTVIEGNSGTSTATLTIVLTNPSSSIVTVDWATNGDTAGSGSDFVSGSGTATFNPGNTSESINVAISGDTSVEGNESFFVNLTNAANGSILDAQATVTIADDDGSPSLTISNVAVDENAGTASLTVLLAPASAQTVTVNASTSAGTATAGADYTTTNTVLTFVAGDTSETIAVPIANDLVSEGAETFSVTLDTPVNAAIANGTATVTIVDDDSTPQLTIDDVNVIEGNAGTTPATFTVSLSHASASTITVNWIATSGSGTSGSDFAAAGGSLTFLAGETSKPVTVSVNGDTSDEADETFFVTLSSPSNATIAKAQGTATIADDDGLPSLVIGDATLVEGNAGSSDLVFTVTLAGATAQTVTVNYATANGTAAAGNDYAATNGTLTFLSGTTTQQVRVAVIGDDAVESDETLFVNLSSANNATISDNQATGTITNDDTAAAVPAISISDASLGEGNAGTANATFTVSLSMATTSAVAVQYATANGSATAGSDYAATSGTVHFAPGVTSQTIAVAVAGDTSVEPDETFTIDLSSPTNATLADSQAAGLIVNDDSPAVVPSISIQDAVVTEGNSGTTAATFNVTLSASTTNTVTVNYATADGSAAAGSDYAATSGTVVFTPGVTAQNITVAVAGDLSVEPDETFTIALSNPTNGTLADNQAAGLIVNDDSSAVVPSITIQDAAVAEGDSGTTAATFNVTLSASTTNTVTVNYATANGSASAGSDYSATSGTIVFTPGVTAQNITVAVAGDLSIEPDETFAVQLTSPTNATLADSQAAGLIVNDDSPSIVPSISIQDAAVTEGNSGTTAATFNVTLSASTTNTVTVNYATANGSASAGSDYAATSGTLVFAPGVTLRTIAVAVAGDTDAEGTETFTVQLSNPANATLADSQASGTINDDDTVTAMPSIRISDANVNEGNDGTRNATFTVRLSSSSATAVTCSYSTSDGSATAGSDYASSAGTVTFAPGTTTRMISVAIAGDDDVEANESFFVTLSAPTNATLADARATGTIVDDDFLAIEPAVVVSDVMIVEGDGGTRAVTFVVTLSTATSIAVSAEYETADGTAVAGADYVAAHGSLLFPSGITSQSVEVSILGDTVIESDETFRLVLRTVTGATGAGSHATATIRDDDSGQPAAILPIAGAGGGAGGAFFRTTLQFHNPREHAMTGNLVIRAMGGGEPHVAPYAVQPHETVDVSAAFGSGFVTVDIAPLTGGMPEAMARVFNDGAERGTAGLTTSLASVADAITAGRRGVLFGPAHGTRLNIGTRALDQGVNVTFALRRPSGEVVEQVTRTLAANVLMHESAAALFSTPLEPNDSIEVSVSAGSAIVYESAVDDITQDPSFVLARPLP